MAKQDRPAPTSTRLRFRGGQGQSLVARLDLPSQGEPVAYALVAHCFTCSKDLKPLVNISRALAGRGIGVFRFDFTGLGESEGDFTDTNFSTTVEDLLAAVDHMRSRMAAPKLLIGHSWGGTAVIRAATEVSEAAGVVTIAAPYDPSHVANVFADTHDEIRQSGAAQVKIAGRTFTISRQFLEDLEGASLRQSLSALNRPLLILHSPQDRVVNIDNAGLIFKAARHPKSFIALDGADHLLLGPEHARYAGELIAQWAQPYL
jgi:putative redox protein